MAVEPKEIVRTLLDSIQDPRVVEALCAPEVTYVSLNYSNSDLHKIMPWCGTPNGVNALIKTFQDLREVLGHGFVPARGYFRRMRKRCRFRSLYVYVDEIAENSYFALRNHLQSEGWKSGLHAIHGGHVLHSFEFSLGWNLEISKRSPRQRSRNLRE